MTIGKIIDGKAFAADLRERVAEGVVQFVAAQGRKPGLAVVLVGEDPASAVYVRNKGKMTAAAGMESFEFRRPANIGQDELLELVEELNGDPRVDGILVQLPLPAHIDEQAVISAIDPLEQGAMMACCLIAERPATESGHGGSFSQAWLRSARSSSLK